MTRWTVCANARTEPVDLAAWASAGIWIWYLASMSVRISAMSTESTGSSLPSVRSSSRRSVGVLSCRTASASMIADVSALTVIFLLLVALTPRIVGRSDRRVSSYDEIRRITRRLCRMIRQGVAVEFGRYQEAAVKTLQGNGTELDSVV